MIAVTRVTSRGSLIWFEAEHLWESTPVVEENAYPTGRRTFLQVGISDAKEGDLTQERTIMTEKGVSEGKRGAPRALHFG